MASLHDFQRNGSREEELQMNAAAIKKLLESAPILPDFTLAQERSGDDHDGKYWPLFSVNHGPDGDMYVWMDGAEPLRFRTPIGGGSSPRTHTALRLLAEAIRLDNIHNPLPRPRVTRADFERSPRAEGSPSLSNVVTKTS